MGYELSNQGEIGPNPGLIIRSNADDGPTCALRRSGVAILAALHTRQCSCSSVIAWKRPHIISRSKPLNIVCQGGYERYPKKVDFLHPNVILNCIMQP